MILVLILAVMLALATPFGNFIAGAIKATTAGFFNVNGNALGSVGITIPGQDFQDTENETSEFAFTIDGVTYKADEGMTWGEWLESDYNTGNWKSGMYYGPGGYIDVVYDPNEGTVFLAETDEIANVLNTIVKNGVYEAIIQAD